MAEWVVMTEMWPKRFTAVISEFDNYRKIGTRIVLVSSAYQPIVDGFARRLDAQAIGSPLIYHDGRLEGMDLPVNAYENKARYIRDKYPRSEILAAFGDTGSDVPMMELSQSPVAVNPDEELRDIAVSRGWRILECSPGSNATS